jgi:glycosyltransferase involved in cell wall biosynthesis
MALGIPVVVTPVGLLREFVTDHKSGYYASTPDEWGAKLSDLVENPDKRIAMGESAYESLEYEGLWLDQYTAKIAELLSVHVED